MLVDKQLNRTAVLHRPHLTWVAAVLAAWSPLIAACSPVGDDVRAPGDAGAGGSTAEAGGASSASTAGAGGSMNDDGCTCDGVACGPNACGQICGQCPINSTCISGECVCLPSCAGKTCGSDGCGATCGTCAAGEICTAGKCVPKPPEPMPDLVPRYFYIDHHSVVAGQASTIHFSIKNQGNADSLNIFKVVVALSANDTLGDGDDVIVTSWDYPYITKAGVDYLWQAPLEIPDGLYNGNYYVGIHLDTLNEVSESDEGNNVLFDSQLVQMKGNPKLDLTPSAPIAQQSSVYPGEMASYTFTVQNLGPDAVASYKVGLYYSEDAQIDTGDALICTHSDINGLPGLGSETIQVTCPVPNLDGQYRFGVGVDPAFVVKEVDETNNTASAPQMISITPLVLDLQMGPITTDDSTVDTGQQVSFSATVTNAGPGTSPPFKVGFYYSTDATITTGDRLVCEILSGQSLPQSQSLTLQATCTAPLMATGQYWLGAIVDSSNQLTETNEENNAGSDVNPVSVLAPNMDLEYYWHWSSGIVHVGDTVSYKVEVKNPGTAPVPNYHASVYYSLDPNLSLDDVLICTRLFETIGANQWAEYQFDCKVPEIPPGNYYLIAVLDPANTIPETDETNNVGIPSPASWIKIFP
jgi:uncharacterized repeat protein (TIGR01451 family)